MAEINLGRVVGPRGPQGEQGAAGPQGPAGADGAKGDRGRIKYLLQQRQKALRTDKHCTAKAAL